jgi:hypothetical protein
MEHFRGRVARRHRRGERHRPRPRRRLRRRRDARGAGRLQDRPLRQAESDLRDAGAEALAVLDERFDRIRAARNP